MLELLAAGVYVWSATGRGRGHTNAGVVVEADGITVIDTLMVPELYEPFADAVEELGLPVRRVVLSSSHIPYSGGSGRFALAAVYGSARTSSDLDKAPNPEGYARLYPEFASQFDHIATRRITHVVSQAAWLTPAIIAVPLAGQIAQNLVVQVPAANVVFAGALGVFGATPLAFDGDPRAWAASLDEVAALGEVIVPGQGRVGNHDNLAQQQAYLLACLEGSARLSELRRERWADWPDAEFDAINAQRASMLEAGDASPPPAILELMGIA